MSIAARVPSFSGRLVALSGLVCGLALGACSAITEFAECKSDLDCQGAGAGYVCGPANTCVPGEGTSTSEPSTGTTTSADPTTGPGATTDDSTTTGTTAPLTSTTSTSDTTETGTTDTTGATDTTTTGPMACSGHTECTDQLGNDYVCIGGECISALTPECQQFHWPGDKPYDKVVFVGSLMATEPPFDTLVVPLQNAVQLAVEDFNANTDLPGAVKIAWLGCDDGAKLDTASAALSHLSDTIGAPVVVGPIFSELVLALAEQAKTSGTLMITPTATAKTISALDDDGLVWRTIPSDVYQASALADRIPMLDPAPAKVAMLYKEDAYGTLLHMDAYERLSTMNPGLDITNHKYPNPVGLTPQEILQMFGTVVANAWGDEGEHPDTIVLVGTTEVTDLILAFMNAWSGENPPPPLPRFITTHGGVAAFPTLIEKAPTMALKQALMDITEGISPIIFDADNFNKFNIRYKIRFNDQDPITAASLSYDAAMVTMLAMAGIPAGEPITGPNVAAAITKTVDKNGTPVSFGEVMGTELTFIKKARNVLVTDGTVDLKGVSGELDFDLDVGEVRVDMLGWGIDPKMGMPDVGVLDPKRTYILAPPPATDGMWIELP